MVKHIDHGVSHHGDTFNITDSQKTAISLLTQKDNVLFRMATELFDEQVRQVEKEFGVVLCNKMK